MKRQIQTNAAVVISGAVRKLDTGQERVRVLLQRSSGRFDGSTTVRPAASMGCGNKTRGYMTAR
jgi:hypothetical protein